MDDHIGISQKSVLSQFFCAASMKFTAMLRLQVFLTQEHLAISMEFAQGGDLFAYTLGHRPHGRLAETQSRWIFQQLIIGLDYCHRKVSLTLTGISAKVQPSSPCISSLACRREQPCISSLASSS